MLRRVPYGIIVRVGVGVLQSIRARRQSPVVPNQSPNTATIDGGVHVCANVGLQFATAIVLVAIVVQGIAVFLESVPNLGRFDKNALVASLQHHGTDPGPDAIDCVANLSILDRIPLLLLLSLPQPRKTAAVEFVLLPQKP